MAPCAYIMAKKSGRAVARHATCGNDELSREERHIESEEGRLDRRKDGEAHGKKKCRLMAPWAYIMAKKKAAGPCWHGLDTSRASPTTATRQEDC